MWFWFPMTGWERKTGLGSISRRLEPDCVPVSPCMIGAIRRPLRCVQAKSTGKSFFKNRGSVGSIWGEYSPLSARVRRGWHRKRWRQRRRRAPSFPMISTSDRSSGPARRLRRLRGRWSSTWISLSEMRKTFKKSWGLRLRG